MRKVAARGFAPFNKTGEQEAIDGIIEDFQPLRDLTPGGGAYLNEVSVAQFVDYHCNG